MNARTQNRAASLETVSSPELLVLLDECDRYIGRWERVHNRARVLSAREEAASFVKRIWSAQRQAIAAELRNRCMRHFGTNAASLAERIG